jgi:hypothetical protein
MKRRGKRKNYPKRHLYKINDTVVFVFAGSKRVGHIVEQTWDEVGMNPKGHATYVIKAQGNFSIHALEQTIVKNLEIF